MPQIAQEITSSQGIYSGSGLLLRLNSDMNIKRYTPIIADPFFLAVK